MERRHRLPCWLLFALLEHHVPGRGDHLDAGRVAGPPALRRFLLPLFVAVGVSILTMKQHFIADGVAGVVLGAAAVWVCFRQREPASEQAVFGWGAVGAYVWIC